MSEPYRVVAITGASGGIGAAIARRFAASGDRLLLLDRRSPPDDLVVGLGGSAGYQAVDVSVTSDAGRGP